ncbi:MAG: polysaccharide biosynthesis tyrosine autokinase [Candidatus Alcyoniella australis]|nr:polysaccharide biosynthesis tyrosine autokinase [Candidatus Alcyoniella australis]
MALRRTGLDLRGYAKIVFKRRWTVIAFFTVVVAVVLVISLLQTKIYRATCTLQIESEAPNVLSIKEIVALGSSNYWEHKEYYQTQFLIIRSRAMAAKVIERMSLRTADPFFSEMREPENSFVRMTGVQPMPNSQLVLVHFDHPDSVQAARICNALAETYRDENLQRRLNASKEAREWLKDETTEMGRRLMDSETKLQEFKELYGIVSFEGRQNVVLEGVSDFSAALTDAKRLRIKDEGLYNEALRARQAGRTTLLAFPPVMKDPLVQSLSAERFTLERERGELANRYLEKHPLMVRNQTELELVDAQLDAQFEMIIRTIEADYKLARNNERDMKSALEQSKTDALELIQKEIDFRVLERDAKSNQQLWDLIQQRSKETAISQNLQTNNVRIVDRAEIPRDHIRPKRRLNMMLAVLFGLVGGISLAFFFEFLDNTIKTQEDIDHGMEVPFLGVIPSFDTDDDANVREELFTHRYPKSSITESLRAIRTNIIFSSPEKQLRNLLITSAGPQEGKSTTVINLGIIFAQSGKTVCIVDSDLRRPRIHRAFGLEKNLGLTNLVVGEAELDDVLVQSDIPNLSLLLCGPIPPNPSELLGSPKMLEVVDLLNERFDLVLFDSPPVVAVTDAVVLSRIMDGVVLIVKTGKTTLDMAIKAKNQLGDVGSHIIGAVLNDFNLRGEGYRYYYYYYRYYHTGEDSSPRSRSKRRSTRRRGPSDSEPPPPSSSA